MVEVDKSKVALEELTKEVGVLRTTLASLISRMQKVHKAQATELIILRNEVQALKEQSKGYNP